MTTREILVQLSGRHWVQGGSFWWLVSHDRLWAWVNEASLAVGMLNEQGQCRVERPPVRDVEEAKRWVEERVKRLQ